MRVRRTVPPVGYRPGGSVLLEALLHGGNDAASERIARQVRERFGMRTAFGVSSGKAALAIVLGVLRSMSPRSRVILPAYTCFSVPSAIVRAGLEPVPCDMAAGSFDYDYDKLLPLLDDSVLCVLSVHLFGIPSDTGRLTRACDGRGIFVVEDAAQAMGCTDDDSFLGTRGDVGFFSLGRGKNITCGAGGLIVTNRSEISDALATVIGSLHGCTVGENMLTLVKLSLLRMFISPGLYWLPSGIPWLKLGDTIFDSDFPIARLSNFGASILRDWPETLAGLNAVRRKHARFYVEHIQGIRDYGDVPYLRFPVMLPRKSKRRVLAQQDGTALGISGMYPAAVTRIPELRAGFRLPDCPEADRIAESLVTLPTHPLLSGRDREEVCELMASALKAN